MDEEELRRRIKEIFRDRVSTWQHSDGSDEDDSMEMHLVTDHVVSECKYYCEAQIKKALNSIQSNRGVKHGR